MGTILDLGNTLNELFNKAKGFVAQNPTPVGFIQKQLQPIEQKTMQPIENFMQRYPTPMSFVQSMPPVQNYTRQVQANLQNPFFNNTGNNPIQWLGKVGQDVMQRGPFEGLQDLTYPFLMNPFVEPITEPITGDIRVANYKSGKLNPLVNALLGQSQPTPQERLAQLQQMLGNIQNVGKQLQKVNLPELNVPQSVKSGFPITQLPEQINAFAQSYGRTLAEPQKHPLETVLNVLPFMGFAKTKTLTQSLSDRLALTKTPEEAAVIYNDFADKVMQTGAKDDLQALRATFAKELNNLGAMTGNYKKDFAILQNIKHDPQIEPIVSVLEGKIASIDEALAKVPKTATERLYNLLNYPQELGARGYNARQIKFISAPEAQRILDEGISPLDHPSYDKMIASTIDQTKTFVKKAFSLPESQGTRAIEQAQQVIDPFLPVTKKVNILDYLRTPERVLQKIGLGDEAKYLRAQYEQYLTQLPEDIKRVSDWQKRIVDPAGNERIFRALDGELVGLTPVEKQVATEIRGYLADWATKLKLPPDKTVSSYITHIWQKGAVEGEFDPEIAKLIDQKVAGGVYDPFLLKRTGGRIDYLKDTWAALDAYTKRAVRKYNLDPALKALQDKSGGLELSQYKYLQTLTDRINLRPTHIDTLIDNFIKSTPLGYRFGPRPVTYLSQKLRQTVYRGALGLNISSALRNLTQGANTYATLGEKWTAVGYLKMLKNYGGDELERVGVLKDSFIQDRQIGVYKSFLDKLDKGLMILFEQAEKINRGSAYWGAKSKALAEGLSDAKAIDYATSIVRKSQFTFSSIDTPLALSSDISKTFAQFMTYNVKQAEFLGDMAVKKDVVGLVRFIGSTIVLQKLMKDKLGMSAGQGDTNTIGGTISNVLPSPSGYTPPAVQIGKAVWDGQKLLWGTDAEKAKAKADLIKAGSLVVPAGVQIKKTIEGLQSYNKGYVGNDSSIKFPVEHTISNLLRSAGFGQYATPEAQKYFDTNATPLSEKQSAAIKDNINAILNYQKIQDKRTSDAQLTQVKNMVGQTGKASYSGSMYVFIDPKSGDTKAIDTSFEPTPPQYTDSTELNKEIRSRFLSEITKKKGIITDMYEQGLLTETEAEKQLADLVTLKDSGGGGTAKKLPASLFKEKAITISKLKALPKTKITTIKIKNPPKIKIAKTKAIKVKPIKIAKLKVPAKLTGRRLV